MTPALLRGALPIGRRASVDTELNTTFEASNQPTYTTYLYGTNRHAIKTDFILNDTPSLVPSL